MINFINVFLSYLILLIIIVILSAVAITIGIYLRKRKDNKAEQADLTYHNSENK